jgi:hypothetical protein
MYLDLSAWSWICRKLRSNYFRVDPFIISCVCSIYVQVTDNYEKGNKGPCPISDAR